MMKIWATWGIAASILTVIGSNPAMAADKVNFMNGWLPGGDYGVPYYAVQKGFFAAEGLDVTVMPSRGSSDVLTKIATGVADVGLAGLAALLQAKAESDLPVEALAAIYPEQPDSIFTTEGSGIKTLKDLEGKKVATATFTSSNVVWPLLLEKNGIDQSKITLQKVDPSALPAMLATGQVAATINWTTAAPGFDVALKDANKKLVMIRWTDYGFEGYGLSLVASDKMIKERPDVLHKVVKVYLKTLVLANKDPEGVAAALKAMVPEIDMKVAEAQFRSTIPLVDNATTRAEGIGTITGKRLAATWEWTAKSQNISMDKIKPESAIDRSFMPK